MRFPALQPHVSQLTDIEARLVALALPFGMFVSLAGAMYKKQEFHGPGQRGLPGPIWNVSNNTAVVQTELPRTTQEANTIFVAITRGGDFQNKCWQGAVDPHKVKAALKELADTLLYRKYGVTVRKDWHLLSDVEKARTPEGIQTRRRAQLDVRCHTYVADQCSKQVGHARRGEPRL